MPGWAELDLAAPGSAVWDLAVRESVAPGWEALGWAEEQ